MFSISSLFIAVIIIAIIVWFASMHIKAKELATVYAKKLCQNHNLQFLDGTTQFKHIKLKRDSRGRVGLLHLYEFEYYDGQNRLRGSLSIFQNKVIDFSIHTKPNYFKSANEHNNVIHFPHSKRNKDE